MILIITHKTDFTADFLINKLNFRRISYYRLNCEDIGDKIKISISSDTKFAPMVDGMSVFKSVWFRRTKIREVNFADPYVEEYYVDELKWFQKNLWNTIECKWLSSPDAVYRAENKFIQLKTAQNIGFDIPKTLISSDFEEIELFFNQCQEEVIIKPIYNNRFYSGSENQLIFTTKIKAIDIETLKKSEPLPSIYQKYIHKKVEIRVTVVGNSIFSAYVDSQQDPMTQIDWRKKRLPFLKYDLPITIQKKCIEIVKQLGLSFGAIDLIETPQGEYLFLEINPNGQWAWIEIDTGLPIADAIIDFLTNE